ncbi:MAG: demethoxyubiquinone hydroxylase family protein [Burkholderiales bacterium]
MSRIAPFPTVPSYRPAPSWPAELEADLRSDHAGETGAVWIYRGVRAVSRDPVLREFAARHGATEADHLARIDATLRRDARSRLLPLWRLAGFATGALPALFGPRAVYATIAAVETFVDRHYAEQLERIDRLDPERADPSLQGLRTLLDDCRRDECAHRDEAAGRAQTPARVGVAMRLWVLAVGAGSAAAVTVCRRF